jgi:RecJ-like exonuclease
MGKFEHEDCSVCLGSGKMVVDERNLCKCCMGEGLNPDLSPEDREAWIDVEFQKRGWFDRHLNPNEYKRLWLRYHREHMVCSSCEGAGYFFFRPDSRKEERRLSSPADFLRDLNDTEEGRREDRRKVL